jgi:hypothetical protein
MEEKMKSLLKQIKEMKTLNRMKIKRKKKINIPNST